MSAMRSPCVLSAEKTTLDPINIISYVIDTYTSEYLRIEGLEFNEENQRLAIKVLEHKLEELGLTCVLDLDIPFSPVKIIDTEHTIESDYYGQQAILDAFKGKPEGQLSPITRKPIRTIVSAKATYTFDLVNAAVFVLNELKEKKEKEKKKEEGAVEGKGKGKRKEKEGEIKTDKQASSKEEAIKKMSIFKLCHDPLEKLYKTEAKKRSLIINILYSTMLQMLFSFDVNIAILHQCLTSFILIVQKPPKDSSKDDDFDEITKLFETVHSECSSPGTRLSRSHKVANIFYDLHVLLLSEADGSQKKYFTLALAHINESFFSDKKEPATDNTTESKCSIM